LQKCTPDRGGVGRIKKPTIDHFFKLNILLVEAQSMFNFGQPKEASNWEITGPEILGQWRAHAPNQLDVGPLLLFQPR